MGYKNWLRTLMIFGHRRIAQCGLYPYTTPTVVPTGTCVPACLESEVVTGGETIILTISGGKWAKTGAVFNAVRQAIIDGLDSNKAEAAGWDVEVKAKEVVGAVVRTSGSVVTITLTASGSYATTVTETITITVPATAMEGQTEAVVATATFAVTTGS